MNKLETICRNVTGVGRVFFVILFLVGIGEVAATGKVWILHATSASTSDAGVTDLRNYLLTNDPSMTVDMRSVYYTSPPLDSLKQYDAVFYFTNNNPNNANTMGDLLADFHDWGGGVVTSTFANQTTSALGGRWISGGYNPTEVGGSYTTSSLVGAAINHSIMEGVSNLSNSYAYTGAVRSGSQQIASYDDGRPLVVSRGDQNVFINGYPAYSDGYGYWTGDFHLLIYNSLKYVMGGFLVPGDLISAANTLLDLSWVIPTHNASNLVSLFWDNGTDTTGTAIFSDQTFYSDTMSQSWDVSTFAQGDSLWLYYKLFNGSDTIVRYSNTPLFVDHLAPTAVSDLDIVAVDASSMKLTWTSPADVGGGNAGSYILKYHSQNETRWSRSWGGVPTPSSAGLVDSVTVTGLQAGTSYSFFLQSADRAGNVSDTSNPVGQITQTDAISPDAVNDLAVLSSSVNSVTLAFTTTGDDGLVGTASSYDLRYSSQPITGANFDISQQVSGSFTPPASGTADTIVVPGLSQVTTYYFALKILDDAGNASTVSNLVSVATTGFPNIQLGTDSLNFTVHEEDSLTRFLTIRNLASGNGNLTVRMEGLGSVQNIVVVGNYNVGTANYLNSDAYLSSKYTFTAFGTDYTWDDIKAYDAVILDEYYGYVSDAEAQAIKRFSRERGGVLMGFYRYHDIASSIRAHLDTVAGISATGNLGYISAGQNNTAHSILTGISSAVINGSSYNSWFKRSQAEWLVKDSQDSVIAVANWASSTVLFSRMVDTYWGSNAQFVRNSIDWLHSMVTASPEVDTVAINDSVFIAVQVKTYNKQSGAYRDTLDIFHNDSTKFNPLRVPIFITIIDTMAPTPVSDLSLSNPGVSTLDLHWTATGDNLLSGTATSYELRYSTVPITSFNYNDAAVFTGILPTPSVSGSPDSVTISSLNQATLYYFALKTRDEQGNSSAVSNVVSMATTGYPDLQLSFTSLRLTVEEGAAPIQSITLKNIGSDTLTFRDSILSASPLLSAGLIDTLGPGDSIIADLSIASSNLQKGSYLDTFAFFSNTPGHPLDTVFLTLEVWDNVAPAKVGDLLHSERDDNSVLLTWTAVGDNDTIGTATSYDIRFSTAPITNANWVLAQTVSAEGIPSIAGSSESYRVYGLQKETLYYFAMKVADEQGNISQLSNVYPVATIGFPIMRTDSTSFSITIQEDTRDSLQLRVFNDLSGAGPLSLRGSSSSLRSSIGKIAIVGNYNASIQSSLSNDPYLSAKYTFTAIGTNYAWTDIKDYDAVILNEYYGYVSTAEAQAIKQFALEKGNVLMGFYYHFWVNAGVREILDSAAGLSGASTNIGSFSAGSNNLAHSIVVGENVFSNNVGNNAALTLNGAEWLVKSSTGDIVATANNSTGTVMLSHYVDAWWADSPQLIRNIIDWFNGGTRAAFSTDTVSVGDSIPVNLHVNVQGLQAGSYIDTVRLQGTDPVNTEDTVFVNLTVIDTVSPDSATLSLGAKGWTSIALAFTAPGDNGLSGTAAEYDLRWSTTLMVDTNDFNLATQVLGEHVPINAGLPDTLLVSGLGKGQVYWFALRSRDELGNWSALSSILHDSTDGTPFGGSFALSPVDTSYQLTIVTPDTFNYHKVHVLYKNGSFPTGIDDLAATLAFADSSGIKRDSLSSLYTGGLINGNTYNFTAFFVDSLSVVRASIQQFSLLSDVKAPAAATALVLTPQDTSVQLQFTVPAEADIQTATVRYSTTSLPLSITDGSLGSTVAVTPGNSEILTVSNLLNGTKYYFSVFLNDEIPNTSPPIGDSAVPVDSFPPLPVGSLVAVGSDAQMNLSWVNNAVHLDMSGVLVRYNLGAVAPTDTGMGILLLDTAVLAGASVLLNHSGLTNNSTYSYTLWAYDTDNNFSSPVSVSALALDTILPDSVTSFALVDGAPASSSILATWVAGGDDITAGTATSYDIRYSKTAITDVPSFLAATQATGIPSPRSSGSADSLLVTGLDTSATYWIAIRSIDNQNNNSTIVVAQHVTARDTIAPATIANLAARPSLLSESGDLQAVTLVWSAPGSDGLVGKAASYELRYSTTALTELNWATATLLVAGVPTPSWAGGSDTVVIPGLATNTQYHFGVKSTDAFGNQSFLSNTDSVLTRTLFLLEDAESPVEGWWSESGFWHRTRAGIETYHKANGGTAAWWYGQDATGNYENGLGNRGSIVSHDLILGKQPVLLFDRWEKTEISAFSDRREVAVSTDGSNWTTVHQSDNSSQSLWATDSVDLSAWSGDTVQIRFRFLTGDALDNAHEGWHVDNVRIYHSGAGVDAVAPTAVADLAVIDSANTSLTLAWTLSGDDAASGVPAGSDLRWNTTAITTQNIWELSTPVSGEKIPTSAGERDTLLVTSLPSGATVHFAVRVFDEALNTSAISNLVSFALFADTTAPAAVADLGAGSIGENSIELAWTSPGDDGNSGTATSYDIRYSTSLMDAVTWPTDLPFVGEPTPLSAGNIQTFQASALLPGTAYWFALRSTDDSSNISGLSNVIQVSTLADTSAPAPVTLAQITRQDNGFVDLQWRSSPAGGGFRGVRLLTRNDGIYPSNETDGTLLVDDTLSGPDSLVTFSQSLLADGVTYLYALFSYDSAGNVSLPVYLYAIPQDTLAPDSASGFNLAYADSSLLLSWTNPSTSDFMGMRIVWDTLSMPTHPDSGNLLLDTTLSPTSSVLYTMSGLNNGKQYFVKIFPYDEVPLYGSGVGDSATPTDTVPPGQVLEFVATTGDGSLALKWLQPADGDLAGTMLRYRTDTWPTSILDGTLLTDTAVVAGDTVQFTHGSLVNDQQIFYSLFTYDEVPNTSAALQGTGTPTDLTAPDSVGALAVVAGNALSTLNWTNPVATDLSGVMIRFRTDGTPPSSPTDGTLALDTAGLTPGAAVSWVHAALTNDQQYVYSVFSYDSHGNYSDAAVRSATPSDPTLPSAPVSFAAVGANGAVTLSWAAVAGANHFVVYRSATAGFVPVLTDSVTTAVGTATGVSDNTAANGSTWYYRLAYRNASNVLSALSLETNATASAFAMSRASVQLSGNFNAWDASEVSNMQPASANIWQKDVLLTAGIHSFRLGLDADFSTWRGESTSPILGTDPSLITGTGDAQAANISFSLIKDAELRFTYNDLTEDYTVSSLAPAAPVGLAAVGGDFQVALNWTASAAVDLLQYQIYRGDSANFVPGVANSLGVSPTNSFTDLTALNDSSYYYVVTAWDNTSHESFFSSVVLGNPVDTVAPAAPALTVTSNDSTLYLAWINPSDADFSRSFFLMRSDAVPDSVNDPLATVVAIDSVNGPSAGSSVTLNPLVNGATYYFAAYSRDEVPLYSIAAIDSGVPADTTAPSAIADLISPDTSVLGFRLMWTATGDDAAVGTATAYDIRFVAGAVMNEAAFAAASQLANEPVPSLASTPETLSVVGLSPGIVYSFGMKVIDDGGNASALSNIFGVTLIDTTSVGPPDTLYAGGSNGSVALEWTKVINPNIDHYAIYRDRYSDFVPASGNLIGTATKNDTTYIDVTASNDTTWYYKVAVVNLTNVTGVATAAVASTPSVYTLGVSSVQFSGSFNAWDESDSANLAPVGNFLWRGSFQLLQGDHQFHFSLGNGFKGEFAGGSTDPVAGTADTLFRGTAVLNESRNMLIRIPADGLYHVAYNDVSRAYTIVTEAPSNPSNPLASAAGDSIVLSWSANSEGDLARYRIYRDTLSGFTPGTANRLDSTTAISYVDNTALPGITYFYRITALDNLGYESGSQEIWASIAGLADDDQIGPTFSAFTPQAVLDNEFFSIEVLITDTSGVYDDLTGSAGQGIYLMYSWTGAPESGTEMELYQVAADTFRTATTIAAGNPGDQLTYKVYAYDNDFDASDPLDRTQSISDPQFISVADDDAIGPSFSAFSPSSTLESTPFAIRVVLSDPSGVYDDATGSLGQGVYLLWDIDGELAIDANEIQLNLLAGDTFVTTGNIPGQLLATAITYRVYAFDNDTDGGSSDRNLGISDVHTVIVTSNAGDNDTDGPLFASFTPQTTTDNQGVLVQVDITDLSGIYDDATGSAGQGVYLKYSWSGTPATGTELLLSNLSGDTYAADASIVATAAGQTLSYIVYAYDNDNDAGSTDRAQSTSAVQYVTVTDDDQTGPSFSSFIPSSQEAGATFSIRVNVSDASGVFDNATGSSGQGMYLLWDDDGELITDAKEVQLTLVTGSTFETDTPIPAQSGSASFVYRIFAYDNDSEGGSGDRSQALSDIHTVLITTNGDDDTEGPVFSNFSVSHSSDSAGIRIRVDINDALSGVFDDVTDTAGQGVYLKWDDDGELGTDIGGVVQLSLKTGNSYETDVNLPQIAAGALLVYQVIAWDNDNDGGASTDRSRSTSGERQVFISDDDTQGPSIILNVSDRHLAGTDFSLTAEISDPSGIEADSVYLLWDNDGELQKDSKRMPLVLQDGNWVSGNLPDLQGGQILVLQVVAWDSDYDGAVDSDRSKSQSAISVVSLSGTGITGRVRNAQGVAIAGAEINFMLDSTEVARTFSANDGSYSMSDLPVGSYVIQVSSPGSMHTDSILNLDAADEEQDFTLYGVGNFDRDSKDLVNTKDLALFATAWKSDSSWFDIGPSTGASDVLEYTEDGLVDYDDLLSLGRVWRNQGNDFVALKKMGLSDGLRIKDGRILFDVSVRALELRWRSSTADPADVRLPADFTNFEGNCTENICSAVYLVLGGEEIADFEVLLSENIRSLEMKSYSSRGTVNASGRVDGLNVNAILASRVRGILLLTPTGFEILWKSENTSPFQVWLSDADGRILQKLASGVLTKGNHRLRYSLGKSQNIRYLVMENSGVRTSWRLP